MSRDDGRIPAALVALSLLLALFVSGGSFLLLVAGWLVCRARRKGRLRGCLALGCGSYLLLTMLVLTLGRTPL